MMFYAPYLTADTADFILDEEEARHCIRVLRKNDGDQINLLDGKGGYYCAEIKVAAIKNCLLKVLTYEFHQPEPMVHVAVAPTKNTSRLEWLLEKGTELGCTHFSLIQTKRTERNSMNMERMSKIMVSAMKQSQRYYLPKLDAPIAFAKFIEANPGGWIAHCCEPVKQSRIEARIERRILIGPEGDFTHEEIALASQFHYLPISLGAARLRTETAALKSIIMLEALREPG